MESQLQIYSGISIFGYVLAAVFLVASVAIFFLMDIKGVYAYLSGKKQQKGIMEMREKQQEEMGKGRLFPDSAKLGFTPPPKPASKKINKETQMNAEKNAGQKQENYINETVNLKNAGNMPDNDATSVLSDVNFVQSEKTDVSEVSPTDVLNATHVNVGSFTLIKNVMEIHTTEVL